jgi:tetratricopeptide (TPR) repeat protein
MRIQTENELLQAYDFLELGDPGRAKLVIEDVLAQNLDSTEVLFALRVVNFWIDKFPLPGETIKSETGDYLIQRWKQFVSFIGETPPNFERIMRAVCKGVFSLALEQYEYTLSAALHNERGDLYRKMGLCHKKLGEYETALSYLAEAGKLLPLNALVLAEMADCHALCGNDRIAKVLFREAFFVDPVKIDLCFLDSELIRCLIAQVAGLGFEGEALVEWIPVYGVLYGVFNVKRELRAFETGKLKQAIFAFETELKEALSNPVVIIPKLINHYFWLIDHLIALQDDRQKIEETLLKIKLLEPDVYKKYTGMGTVE